MISLVQRAITAGNNHPADIAITAWGKDWYWTLTALFALCGVAFIAGSFRAHRNELSTLFCLSALACNIYSMGYFAMAADLGWVAVEVEFARGSWVALNAHPTRQVFWIRYAMWLVATPLLMTELLLLISAPLEVILLDVFMIFIVMATGLGGAVIPSAYKWAYYFYGAIACAGIIFLIAHKGYRLAASKGKSMRRMYIFCSVALLTLWFGYGLAWGLSEGGNVLSPDGEGVFYGLLDLIGGPLYGILIALAALKNPCEPSAEPLEM